MLEGLQVYHNTFGYGVIIKDIGYRYDIQFEDKKRSIYGMFWLVTLFLNEEDEELKDDPETIKKYTNLGLRVYKRDEIREELDKMKLFQGNETIAQEIEKSYKLKGIDDLYTRNIFILYTKECVINNKRYMDILGIDIYTGYIVKIVDADGLAYNKYHYKENTKAFEYGMIITAEFEMHYSERELNTLKMVSDYTSYETSTIEKLVNKYQYQSNKFYLGEIKVIKKRGTEVKYLARYGTMKPMAFNLERQIYSDNIKVEKEYRFYQIIKLNMAKILENETEDGQSIKYITISDFFINIACETKKEKNERTYFKGYALLEIKMFKEFEINALNMWGEYYVEIKK